MTEILIDYSQIQLQENISLSDAEIKKIEEDQKKLSKLIPTILAFCTLFTMAIPIFCIESFSKFKNTMIISYLPPEDWLCLVSLI
jgi:hypothetical protein